MQVIRFVTTNQLVCRRDGRLSQVPSIIIILDLPTTFLLRENIHLTLPAKALVITTPTCMYLSRLGLMDTG